MTVINIDPASVLELAGLPAGVTRTLQNVGSSTIYFDSQPQVSSSKNAGSVTPGNTVTIGISPCYIASPGGDGQVDEELSTQTAGPWASASATNLAKANVRVSKLTVCGHSIPAGQNEAARAGNRFPSIVAALLGATENNVAVGGSALCTDNIANRAAAFWTVSGGWITCMATNPPNRSGDTDFSGNVVSGFQVVILMHGYNDLGVIGPPGQNLANKAAKGGVFDTTFPPAMIATINRLRCGHLAYVWNGTDSGSAQRGQTVFDAAWTKFTGTGITSTGFGAFPTTAGTPGATAVSTVPSWYQGGQAIDLLFVASLNNQGSFTISLDGVQLGIADGTQILATSEVTTREQTPFSFRIPGNKLSAGSHTISTVFNGGTGSPYFDSWSIEASTPPLVVIPKMYQDARGDQQPPGNQDGTGAANYNVRNSDILALNKVLDGIAMGYPDGRVITVDTDAVINQNLRNLQTGPDTIHPSMIGHSLVANKVVDAIRTYYQANPQDLAHTGHG